MVANNPADMTMGPDAAGPNDLAMAGGDLAMGGGGDLAGADAAGGPTPGGCGCRVGGRAPAGSGLLALVLLLLALRRLRENE